MKKLFPVMMVLVLVFVSGCGDNDSTIQGSNSSESSITLENQPVKDCNYFQELATDLRARTDGRHTKIITEDFISQWTYVVMNNSNCFSQQEYCQALYAKNSITPVGRQESSPYC
jgi:hypothetical protein